MLFASVPVYYHAKSPYKVIFIGGIWKFGDKIMITTGKVGDWVWTGFSLVWILLIIVYD